MKRGLTILGGFILLGCLLGPTLRAQASESRLRLRGYFPEGIRVRTDYHASVEICWIAPRGEEVRLRDLRLLTGGTVVLDKEIRQSLYGDDGWFENLNALLESIPPEFSYRYTHRQTPSPTVTDKGEIIATLAKIEDMIGATRRDSYRREHPSVFLADLDIPVAKILRESEFRPGQKADLDFVVSYLTRDGLREEHFVTSLEVLEDFPRVNLKAAGINMSGGWYQGDLHVHDCKDEASLFGERGCPDCQAESFNWGDDNTLAQLKSQYQALGAEWFTSSSHSYCINSDAEYSGVRDDCARLSGSDFLIIPDTELSSDEEGPLTGDDLFDATCLNGVNHMGAHWITQRMPGGSDGFLEYCSEPKYPFSDNLTQIQSQGGFGEINHPAYSEFGWNSVEMTHGFQAGGFRGVEIWNGPIMRPGGPNVSWWVNMLLRGEKLYAYSGSDTHDDVFDYGWNHVYLNGALTSTNLKRALMQGHSYVSNYQAAAIVGRIPGNPWQLMGGEIVVPAIGPTTIQLAINYNLGTKTGNVTVYKGRAGDPAETVLRTLSGLSGAGWRSVTDVAYTGGLSYYRLQSDIPGEDLYAYSNPIWIRPQ